MIHKLLKLHSQFCKFRILFSKGKKKNLIRQVLWRLNTISSNDEQNLSHSWLKYTGLNLCIGLNLSTTSVNDYCVILSRAFTISARVTQLEDWSNADLEILFSAQDSPVLAFWWSEGGSTDEPSTWLAIVVLSWRPVLAWFQVLGHSYYLNS